jgi:hypothetical protein
MKEALPFNCDCDAASLTAVCDSSEVCNHDTCATFHVVNTFDTSFSLLYVQTCAEYTKQVADDLDGCVNITLSDNGKMFDTCEMAFFDDSGKLINCDGCRICDGRLDSVTFEFNCSNIEVEASTAGCMAVNDTDLFPGFLGEASAESDGPPVGLVWAAAAATLLIGLHSF